MNDRNAVFMPVSDTERKFVVGMVEHTAPSALVAVFESPQGCPQPGEQTELYFKQEKCFLRQRWKIVSVLPGERGFKISFSGPAEPEPGCMRGSERIPTAVAGMTAKLDGESDCLVLDLSEQGIALVAAANHEVGAVVHFEMWARDTLYAGFVKVCNAAELPRGRTRYGLQVVEDPGDDRLQRSMRRLWLALRLRQLESLST